MLFTPEPNGIQQTNLYYVAVMLLLSLLLINGINSQCTADISAYGDDSLTFDVSYDNGNTWNNVGSTLVWNQILNEEDIEDFVAKANEATLNLFKTSNSFRGDYVLNDFMTSKEKVADLDMLIEFFEDLERYEDCAYLVKIKDKIVANEEFKTK